MAEGFDSPKTPLEFEDLGCDAPPKIPEELEDEG